MLKTYILLQAQLNFQKYIEPITKGEATVDDAHKLWRNIEPHLKKALQTIYLREVFKVKKKRICFLAI